MFFNLVGIPSSVQYQGCVKTVGATMTGLGSRIKNRQKSLVGATNHPVGVGNASLIGWFIFYFKRQKPPAHWWFLLPATRIKLVQIYYICLDGQLVFFFCGKNGLLEELSSTYAFIQSQKKVIRLINSVSWLGSRGRWLGSLYLFSRIKFKEKNGFVVKDIGGQQLLRKELFWKWLSFLCQIWI